MTNFHKSERLVLEIRDMSDLPFLPQHVEICLAHSRESVNVVQVNEWLHFTWKSDGIMQDNLKVHFTQEKNEPEHSEHGKLQYFSLKK